MHNVCRNRAWEITRNHVWEITRNHAWKISIKLAQNLTKRPTWDIIKNMEITVKILDNKWKWAKKNVHVCMEIMRIHAWEMTKSYV